MSDDVVRGGGCSCGAVRFETTGDPVRVGVCHCKECQLRTGSAFGISCYFPADNVKVVQGSPKTYERTSDSGRWARIQFCSQCGSSVLFRVEARPESIGVAGGAFDDTDWIQPELHAWARSAQRWLELPDDVPVLQESAVGKKS
jgi:hypothetical protein